MNKKDIIYLCLTVSLFVSSLTLILYVLWPAVAMVWMIIVFAAWCWSFANPDKEEKR